MRILVVGNGIGGSAVARKAREQGHHVTVRADSHRPAAATAALCVVCPDWWSGAEKEQANRAVSWYYELGAVTSGRARYTKYNDDLDVARMGYFAIDPAKVLVPADEDGVWGAHDEPNGYDRVVLCRGAYGPEDGKRTWGVTTIVRCDGPTEMLRAHFSRPRELLFACSHQPGVIRFGSSVSTTEQKAYEAQFRMERRAKASGLIPDGDITHVAGVRLMPEPFAQAGRIVAWNERVVALHTFGRVGFSVAPTRAEQLLAML